MLGEFFFLGLGSIVSNLVFAVLVLVVAVAVGTGRGQPDPRGHRLKATYLCVVLFFSLFAALVAATSTADSLMDLTRSDDESAADFEEPTPFGGGSGFAGGSRFDDGETTDEDAAAGLVGSLFLAGAAAGVLAYHRRRLLEMAEEDDFVGGPAATVFSAYLYASSLVALLTLVAGTAIALSGLVQVVAPGTFSVDEADLARQEGAREAFVGGFLAMASMAIVVLHQRDRVLVEPDDDEPTFDDDPIA